MESFASHLRSLEELALSLRLELLQMLHHTGSGHTGGSLSAMDILIALYYGQLPEGPVLKYDPQRPGGKEHDYVVLSKGHATAAWYTVLADAGFFPKEELTHYRKMNSSLQAYPLQKTPGVLLSSGFPGYGFAAAVGLAMALKADRQPNRVFCILGDGELQAGQTWEAALLAAQYKLDNLTAIVDWNGLQMDGSVRAVVNVEPVMEKFESFGWKGIPVTNGHDFDQLLAGLEKGFQVQRRPGVLICRTVKGKGVPFAERRAHYHAEVFSDEEMSEATAHLERAMQAFQESSASHL